MSQWQIILGYLVPRVQRPCVRPSQRPAQILSREQSCPLSDHTDGPWDPQKLGSWGPPAACTQHVVPPPSSRPRSVAPSCPLSMSRPSSPRVLRLCPTLFRFPLRCPRCGADCAGGLRARRFVLRDGRGRGNGRCGALRRPRPRRPRSPAFHPPSFILFACAERPLFDIRARAGPQRPTRSRSRRRQGHRDRARLSVPDGGSVPSGLDPLSLRSVVTPAFDVQGSGCCAAFWVCAGPRRLPRSQSRRRQDLRAFALHPLPPSLVALVAWYAQRRGNLGSFRHRFG